MKHRTRLLTFVFLLVGPVVAHGQAKKADPFDQWDRNKDGRLAREEVPRQARTRFDQMDADRDGVVTRDELTTFRQRQGTRFVQRLRAGARPPTHANVSYGPHKRNVLDLYLAKSDKPTPLVLYIHGGGFRGGDKRSLGAATVKSYFEAGFSAAAINYRLTDTAPAPAAYLDCARALQFLRYNAKKWNIDPRLIASTGGSAGAGTSLWLAFHDDLADPKSEDPISRQSTRLVCAVVSNGQSSYDPRFAEKIGIPRPNFERHPFFLPFYGITADQIDTPRAYRLYEQAAPITYLTKDDPPVLLLYNLPNTEVKKDTPLNVIVHHPKFGIALKDQMDKLGIECIVQYPAAESRRQKRHGEEAPIVSTVEFISKQFDRARKKAG